MVFWLPLVRGLFDGLSYEWGGFGFSGRGTIGCWHLYLAFTTASAAISDPASLRFQGETLGVDVSFAVAAPVFMGVAAALVMQLVLLRVGEPHGTTDQIGVLVTIAQWFLLGIAVRLKPGPQMQRAGPALA